MGEVLAPVVDEVIGWIIKEGVKWLIGFIIGENGEKEPVRFIDDDGDGVPDNPDDPFLPWDPTELFPDVEPANEITYVMINPDGTMTIYDEAGNITAEVADNAYSLWLSENAALDKPFKNYSVTEALLLIVALGSLVGLVSKIFKRRKL